MNDISNNIKRLYHGTETENAKKILEHKKFNIVKPPVPIVHNGVSKVKKNPGTLGYGVYFFSSLHMVQKFSEKMKDTKILVTVVELKEETTLDLTQEETLERYNMFKEKLSKLPIYKQLSKAFKNSGPQSSLEGIMLDHLISNSKNIEEIFQLSKVHCIKGMTVTEIDMSRHSKLGNAVEYCVKNHDCIKEISYYEKVQ